MSSPYRRRHRQGNGLLFLILIMAFAASRSCDKRTSTPPPSSQVSTPVRNPIQDVLRPVAPAQYREGIVAAILIDTSGSMKERVRDADGAMQPKISIAQRAALKLVDQFDTYDGDLIALTGTISNPALSRPATPGTTSEA